MVLRVETGKLRFRSFKKWDVVGQDQNLGSITEAAVAA